MTNALTHTPRGAAAAYVAKGWPVLPLHTPTATGCTCRSSDCTSIGKHPRINRGVHRASTDARQIASWWRRWPDANVAIATGALIVLDVDGEHGAHSLHELQSLHEQLPTTAWVATARGRHLYFRSPDLVVRNSAGRLGRGLDIRGQGGFAVAPPSRHSSGHRYHWNQLDADIADMPMWLAELSAPIPRPARATSVSTELLDRYVAAALEGELDRIASAPPHTRNDTVNRAAFKLGQLAGAGVVDVCTLEALLYEAALAVGQGEREARATIASGLSAGQSSPRVIQECHRHATSDSLA